MYPVFHESGEYISPGKTDERNKTVRVPVPGETCRLPRYLLIISIAVILIAIIAIPASAISGSDISVQPRGARPRVVNVTIFGFDFNRFDVAAGTAGVGYYVNLKSDSPVSIDDIELMTGSCIIPARRRLR
jgi:hypothetical protein